MTYYKLVPKSNVDELAQFIRKVDGNHKMGAGALAEKICERFRVNTPAVQGEPVGWQFYQDGKWWNGDDRIKDHRKNTEAAGVPVRDVYATPQPAEQQPDVAPQAARQQVVASGFRVMKPTSSVVRDGERWEIYAPCGSGGIVHEDEVTDWVVRKLLDALASAPQAEQQSAVTQLVEALEDMLSGWRYIRESHGDLYGVGWDRAENKARAALAAHHKQEGNHDNQ